jgi:hypothetical protein
MIKKAFIFFLFSLLAVAAYSAKVGTLPEVMKPDNISIYQDELYVVEGAKISVYSLDELKLLRQFGKKGEGPGELMVIPYIYYNRVAVSKEFVLAESFNKLVFFTRDGTFKKEKMKGQETGRINQTLPVGKNFVVKKLRLGDDRIAYTVIAVHDPELKEIKELYRQKFVQQVQQGKQVQLEMVMDFVDFKVYDDKIYIEESPNGFVIEVFDSEGKKLDRIQKEYEKLEVTSAHRERILDRFKNDPSIKAQSKQAGGWNELKKIIKTNFADTFPAIRSFGISGGKMYVQTFKVKDNKDEYVIMDLKGKILKRAYVQAFRNVPLTGELLSVKLNTVHNGKLYYVMENEDEEEWELHVEELEK